MLVPVQGGVTNLQKRNRTIHEQTAALATVDLPLVYLFNVGPRPWCGVGGGRSWVIPACPKGARHSKGIAVPSLCLSERDLADGGNNLDTIMDSAISGTRTINGEVKHIAGVVNDIIGAQSTTPGLDIHTTNGEWFGVFWSRDEEPSDEEIEAAEEKLRDMAQLIYQTGSEKVQGGEKVTFKDRTNFNWAAQYLGQTPLWGNLDHQLDECPECHEDVRKGAKVCKHCQLPIDEASVQARAKKRQRDAEKMLKDETSTN